MHFALCIVGSVHLLVERCPGYCVMYPVYNYYYVTDDTVPIFTDVPKQISAQQTWKQTRRKWKSSSRRQPNPQQQEVIIGMPYGINLKISKRASTLQYHN